MWIKMDGYKVDKYSQICNIYIYIYTLSSLHFQFAHLDIDFVSESWDWGQI